MFCFASLQLLLPWPLNRAGSNEITEFLLVCEKKKKIIGIHLRQEIPTLRSPIQSFASHLNGRPSGWDFTVSNDSVYLPLHSNTQHIFIWHCHQISIRVNFVHSCTTAFRYQVGITLYIFLFKFYIYLQLQRSSRDNSHR